MASPAASSANPIKVASASRKLGDSSPASAAYWAANSPYSDSAPAEAA